MRGGEGPTHRREGSTRGGSLQHTREGLHIGEERAPHIRGEVLHIREKGSTRKRGEGSTHTRGGLHI